ncbi:MAG: diadenylate cyclase CdaA [Candidatus Cloacimonadaceae bacterium]
MSFLIPTFSDIVDILLIAFLIYEGIVILKRSGSYRVLYAILIIIGLYILSNLFNLKMVSGILNSFKEMWLVLLVIIFQPELRDALSKIKWSNPPARHKNNLSNKEFSGALIDAISAMSFRKIGALIVIERKRRLTEYINAGELLDSVLSLRLILSIFNPKSVLHDGAIIIRDNRIVAAKVVLPLSTNPANKLKFGTRHLAAIGITEVSDALAIVVSEQTGRVSVASNGKIKTDVVFEELMQIISDATK